MTFSVYAVAEAFVVVRLVPFVLLYQGWTYWVFRHRVGAEDFGDVRTPLDLLDRHARAEASDEPRATP